MATARDKMKAAPAERVMFTTTSWTAVVAAGRSDSPEAQEALNQLCSAYWEPVHAYLRRYLRCRGQNEDDAEDLTQEFFYLLLRKNYLRVADRERGRFRSFLLTAVNHFLSNEKDRAHAAKRGGGRIIVSLDEPGEDDEPRFNPASELSPMKIFEREWATTLFRNAEARLQQEYTASGKGVLFERLKEFLDARTDSGEYAAAAVELGMKSGAVAVAVHRLRHRLGELTRAAVADTLVNPTPAEVERERRHLFEIFGQ